MSVVLELGEKLPELLVNVRRNSSQGWKLTLTDKTTNSPVTIDGSVVLEVDGASLWVGQVSGSSVTWQLDAADTNLRLGRHPAALVRLFGDTGREVWARGMVVVE